VCHFLLVVSMAFPHIVTIPTPPQCCHGNTHANSALSCHYPYSLCPRSTSTFYGDPVLLFFLTTHQYYHRCCATQATEPWKVCNILPHVAKFLHH
jgi:hypothetical protein